MRRSWVTRPIHEKGTQHLAEELSLSPAVAQLLIHRGADSSSKAHDFLYADLSSLPDPARMAGLEKAAFLIRTAVAQKEKILVVGDYDVDGLTGSALLVRVLKELGGHVSWHIPHRMNDGYGLKSDVVRKAAASEVKLLISVDCGTTHVEELVLAKKLGVETIVIDHHELLPSGAPPASAFLNPLQPECRYPTKELSSVGVAFTLARALLSDPWDHLDLVALGTIADVAPLVGENHTLVKRGLTRLQGTSKPGLRALMEIARLKKEDLVSSEDVGFALAPRLNAMGRMGQAGVSLELLLSEDPEEAGRLAQTLEKNNLLRRQAQQEAAIGIFSRVEREVNFARERVIVVESERWHPGVVGILANRLLYSFHRPAVVIALDGELGRGSARSFPFFHLVEAFEEVKEHLVTFGGHAQAAGLTISRGSIPAFKKAINESAARRIDPKDLAPILQVDGELPLAQATESFARELEALAPFGTGNLRPIFTSEDVRSGKKVRVAYTPIYKNRGKRPQVTIKVRDLVWL